MGAAATKSDVHDRRYIEVKVQEYGGEWTPVGIILLPAAGKLGGFRYADDYDGPPIAPDLDYRAQGNRFFAVRPDLSPQDRGRNARDLHAVFVDALPGVWGATVMESHNRAYRDSSPAEKLWMLGDWRNGGIRFSSTGPDHLERFIEGYEALEALRRDVDRFITRLVSDRAIPFRLGSDEQRWALSNTGGTSPKCSYIHDDGREFVVKFPPDVIGEVDKGRVERAMLAVSHQAGIHTADAMLIEGENHAGVLATRRFDVRLDGTYVHTISGNVATGISPMASADYLDLVQFLQEQGGQPERDIDDLYGRMLLNAFAHNTDDHLGQFVFQRDIGDEWHLAPNHDIIPSPLGANGERQPHQLTMCGDAHAEYSVAWIDRTAQAFGIDLERGREIAMRVLRAVEHAPAYAANYGVSPDTLQEIEPALRLADAAQLKEALIVAAAAPKPAPGKPAMR